MNNYKKNANDKDKQNDPPPPLTHTHYLLFQGFSECVTKKIIFLFLNQNMWVLKRTVSMRRFFWAPKTYVKTDG